MADPQSWDEYMAAIAPASESAGPASWDEYMQGFEAPKKPVEGGFVASAKQVAGATIKGAGQVAADIGLAGQDNALKEYGQGIIDRNTTAVTSLEGIAERPLTAAAEATGNAASSMGAIVAARLAGNALTAAAPLTGPAAPIVAAIGQAVAWFGPAAIASLPSFGSIREKQILNDPENEESGKAKAVAALGAATVGYIETKLGPQNWALAAFSKEGRAKLAKQFAATTLTGKVAQGVVRGGLEEGAEELIQSPIEQAASFDDPTTPENVKDTLFQGAMGAIGGGVLGGGFTGAQHVVSPSTKDVLKQPDVDSAIEVFQHNIDTGAMPPIDPSTYKDLTTDEIAANQATLLKAVENDIAFAQAEDGTPTFNGAPLRAVAPQELPTHAEADEDALSRDEYEAASALAKALGKSVVVVEDQENLPMEGFVGKEAAPDTIFISTRMKNGALAVLGHEMDHLAGESEAHANFVKVFREEITEQANEVARARHDRKDADGNPIALSDAKLEREQLADIAGDAWADPTFHDRVIVKMREQLGDKQAESIATTFLQSITNLIGRVKAVLTGTTFTTPDGKRLATQYVNDLSRVQDALAAAIADNFIQKGYRPPGAQTNSSQLLLARTLELQRQKAQWEDDPAKTPEQNSALRAIMDRVPYPAIPFGASPSLVSALESAQKEPAFRDKSERLNIEAIQLGIRMSPKVNGRIEQKGDTVAIRLTPSENSFFEQIFASAGDKAELTETVPSVGYEKGVITVAAKDAAALADYTDQTVSAEKGEGNSRLPPSFYKATFPPKLQMSPKQGEKAKIEAARVRSPEFKKWFADSKVVDEKGEPLTVYHGTGAEVAEFRTRRSKSESRLGAYFTADGEAAGAMASIRGSMAVAGREPKAYPVHLSLQNPIDLRAVPANQLADAVGVGGKVGANDPNGRGGAGAYRILEWLDKQHDIVPLLKKRGHDGIIFTDQVEGDTYVAFRPEQIKSVFNDKPTDSPNISLSPKSEAAKLEARTSPRRGVLVNIGLDVGDKKNAVSEKKAKTALKLAGVKVLDSQLQQSDTENTLVASLDRALTRKEMASLTMNLQQEAIPQLVEGKGEMHGPQAEKWGPFNPEYFWTLDGKRLSEVQPEKRAPATKDKVTGVPLTKAMRSSSLDEFLYGDRLPFTVSTQAELGELLEEMATTYATARTEDTPDNREFVARVIEHEARLALSQEGHAAGWYSKTTDAALRIAALIHPEIATDADARFAFTYALAVTSNGVSIPENIRNAFTVYKSFAKRGKMPDLGFGVRHNIMQIAFHTWNEITKKIGVSGFRDFMLSKRPVRELKKISPDMRELITDSVYGGTIIGPKIGGAFLQNLNGNHDALAMDRWFMRTWGRITGSLVHWKEGAKATRDAPSSGGERHYIRATMSTALERLQREHPELTTSDLQALLWYPEKDLYAMHGVNDESGKPTDYEIEAAKYAEQKGISTEAIERARELQPDQPAGRGDGDKPGGLAGADQVQPEAESRGNERAGSDGREDGAAVQRSPKQKGLDLVGVHFSKEPRTFLSGAFYGTGMKGEEARRVLAAQDKRLRSRVYAYINLGQGVKPEAYVGAQAHTVPMNNIYDLDEDALNLVQPDKNTFESALLDAGYDGYFAREDNQGIAVLIGEKARVAAEPKGFDYRGEDLEVPPAPTYTAGKQLALAIANSKLLPSGEMSGADWKVDLARLTPELATPEVLGKLQDDIRYYKSDIGRLANDNSGSVSVQLSPKGFQNLYRQKVSELEAAKREGDTRLIQRITQEPLPVSETPAALQEMQRKDGSKPLKRSKYILGTVSTVIQKGRNEHANSDHRVAIPHDILERLPALLADPLAVFDRRSKAAVAGEYNNSVLVFTREKVAGKYVAVAIKPDDKYGSEQVNSILSVHPRTAGQMELYRAEGSELKPSGYLQNKTAEADLGSIPGASTAGGNVPEADGGVKLSPKNPFPESTVQQVVYHSTTQEFTRFKPSARDLGIHFGTSEQAAKRFRTRIKADPYGPDLRDTRHLTIPVHIDLRNPLRTIDAGDWGNMHQVAVTLDKALGGDTFKNESLGRISKGENVANKTGRRKVLQDFVQKLEEMGYDGIVYKNRNEGKGDSHIAFRPEQIKSIFNDDSTPSAQFSPKITGDSKRQYTAAQRQMFTNTGRTIDEKSLVQRIAGLRKDLGKKLAQGLVDQFAPIKELSPMAYMLARLSKGSAGAFEALLRHGKLRLRGGAYDADRSGGFIEKVGIPLHGELEDFLWWVAANRADRLSKEDREHLFSPADIVAGKSLANGSTSFDYKTRSGATTRSRNLIYVDALKSFDEFNKNTLDMAEQSGLINSESRKLWEHEFYVPFYRVSDEDGSFIGAKMGNTLVRQRAFRHLKGGTQKLNSDLLANTLANWAHLIDASAKNRAAKSAIEAAAQGPNPVAVEADKHTVAAMAGSIGKKGSTVWFMDGGTQRHFLVDDPYVMTAITSLEYAGMRGPLMDALSTMKHVLTVGVTASPAFKVRNLIRDSLQAIGTAPIGYNPLGNIKEGFAASEHSTQTYVSALASGGLIRFGTMLEGRMSDRVRQLVKAGIKDTTILDSDAKFQAMYDRLIEPAVAAYNELGNRSEEITRAALYKQLTDKGMDHAQASLMVRDLMDFSMQGSWTGIRFLTQVVPFMNARMQGLYKLGRAAKQDPSRFAAVLGATALFSIALLAAYGDDDDWKKREDWDRDNFWWFKMGGVAFRIPKPFEIGAIATLAERGLEYFSDPEMTGERFNSRVLSLLANNLSMNPVPQLVKPIVDVYANQDSFTGRPIESMGMERLQPDYRFTSRSSMAARAASTAGQAVTSAAGVDFLSPVQIDHMLRGYFGWLGSFVVGASEVATRPASGQPTRPAGDTWRFTTQGFVSELPADQSRYVSQMYEQAKVIEQAYGTYRSILKQGKPVEAKEFLDDNRDKLMKYKSIEAVKRAESKFNERIRIIERSALDPDAKKTAIAAIAREKDRVARMVK